MLSATRDTTTDPSVYKSTIYDSSLLQSSTPLGQRERKKTRSRRCSKHRSTHPTASQRFPPPQEHPTHPPSEGGAAAAASTPQHARICHSAIVSIPVASRQDTLAAGVRTPSIHENPHSLLIVSAGKTPPTCDEIVDLRPSACGHNNIC